jgi:hypothetical protein
LGYRPHAAISKSTPNARWFGISGSSATALKVFGQDCYVKRHTKLKSDLKRSNLAIFLRYGGPKRSYVTGVVYDDKLHVLPPDVDVTWPTFTSFEVAKKLKASSSIAHYTPKTQQTKLTTSPVFSSGCLPAARARPILPPSGEGSTTLSDNDESSVDSESDICGNLLASQCGKVAHRTPRRKMRGHGLHTRQGGCRPLRPGWSLSVESR